ncbi:MAG: PTS sugar transporter subunit IIA [Spirochaetes bacterium]|nr:PTS sugar transporter subunit IIA [Spirochaetota bacterium]
MDPARFIDPKNIVPDLQGGGKREVIEELLDRLIATETVSPQHREEILHELLERENKGSTAIGFEIAIPHAKTDQVAEIAVALGLHRAGIPYNTNDGKPVRICILTLSSKKATGPHLQFMATICNQLKEEKVRKNLLACKTAEQVDALLKKTAS